MKKNLALGLMTLTAMGLAACGSSTKQAASNELSGPVKAAGLENTTYTSDCTNVPFDPLHLNAYKVAYNFHGDFTKTTTYYSDNACQQAQVLVVTETGDFVPHGNVNGDSLVLQADMRFTKVTITPKQDDITNDMNKVPGIPTKHDGFCGVQDWSNGKPNDITPAWGDLNCFGLGQGKIGVTTYDIISTRDNQLKFGLAVSGDKSTPDKRPTQVDPAVLGKKQ